MAPAEPPVKNALSTTLLIVATTPAAPPSKNFTSALSGVVAVDQLLMSDQLVLVLTAFVPCQTVWADANWPNKKPATRNAEVRSVRVTFFILCLQVLMLLRRIAGF